MYICFLVSMYSCIVTLLYECSVVCMFICISVFVYACLSIYMVKYSLDNNSLCTLSFFVLHSLLPFPYLRFSIEKIAYKEYEETNQTPPVDGGI